MVPGEGQATPQAEAIAGAGEAANPWREYGLNPDGTPLAERQPEGAKPDLASENAVLKSKLADLESKIAKLPDSFAGMNKKLELVDRVIKAVAGDSGGAGDAEVYQNVWADLKNVAKRAAPEAYKLFDLLEKQPGALDSLTSQVSQLQASHVIGLNEKAHDRVVDLAKKAGFRGSTDGELNEMIYPFEQSMTMMINSNADLRRAFLSGNLTVVDEIFNRMIKPHVAQRLREKQARLKTSNIPTAVPRGAGSASGGQDEQRPQRNLATPQGRADFHKKAVNRWLDKVSSRDE